MEQLLGWGRGPQRLPHNSDVQRILVSESAARAKLQRRVDELESELRTKDAEVAHHRNQRDVLHAQVLATRGAPSPRGSLSPTVSSKNGSPVAAPTGDDNQLWQVVGELQQQVVTSASTSHTAAAKATQLQRELDGARSVIEALQQQLRKEQQQHRRPGMPLAVRHPGDGDSAQEQKLEQRLQQCERERDQYAAACEQLRRSGARAASDAQQHMAEQRELQQQQQRTLTLLASPAAARTPLPMSSSSSASPTAATPAASLPPPPPPLPRPPPPRAASDELAAWQLRLLAASLQEMIFVTQRQQAAATKAGEAATPAEGGPPATAGHGELRGCLQTAQTMLEQFATMEDATVEVDEAAAPPSQLQEAPAPPSPASSLHGLA